MLVDVSDFSSTFQDIVQKNFQEKAAILILVAPDVDALCACRILTVCLVSLIAEPDSFSFANSRFCRHCFVRTM